MMNEIGYRRLLVPVFALAMWIAAGQDAAAGTKGSERADIHFVPFSHLDFYWGGKREECLSRGSRIIAKALELAKKSPEFRFLLEDDVFVANFVDSHRGLPEVEELKQLVKAGRIEIAPKWAGIYQNLPRGSDDGRIPRPRAPGPAGQPPRRTDRRC
jgi:hypothetical protein